MGRPRKEVPKTAEVNLHEMVRKLAETGVAQPVIAGVLGISDKTFRNRMDEDEELRLAWERGHAGWQALISKGIHNKVKEEDVRMLIFAGKTVLGLRETSGVHITGGIEDALKELAAEDGDDGE